MEIVKDQLIKEKWHRGFERKQPIDEIVLHGTGGGGTYQYVLQGGRKELYIKGIALFHYLIEQNGKTIEIIDPERWVYHSSSGKHDERTIGIELLNPDFQNKGSYTEQQYKSLFELIDLLMSANRIERIVSHKYNYMTFSGDTKNCPGNFNWIRLGDHLKQKKVKYTNTNSECFEVI